MNKKVLIIEDNEQNMYLLKYLLENNGFIVTGAENGIDGIKTANDIKPDLIILDIQLPGLNGYEVAKELRKIEHLKVVPILAVTSYAMPGDREAVIEAGASGYIEKPINPDTFISQIEYFL